MSDSNISLTDFDLESIIANDPAQLYNLKVDTLDVTDAFTDMMNVIQSQCYELSNEGSSEILFNYETYSTMLESLMLRMLQDLHLIGMYLYSETIWSMTNAYLPVNALAKELRGTLLLYNFKKFIVYHLYHTGTDSDHDHAIASASAVASEAELVSIRKMINAMPDEYSAKFADWYETLITKLRK